VRAPPKHHNAQLHRCTTTQTKNLPFRKMKLLLLAPLASLHLALAQKITAEPGVDVTVRPSDGSIAIDVRIDVEGALPVPARPGKAIFIANATRSSFALRTGDAESTMRALCAPESHTSDPSTSSRLPTATIQRFFPNSTSSSLASASARPPFPVDFAAFSGGSSVSSQSSLSLVAAAASCCVGMATFL
jgi:hypothetical protein